MTHINPGQDAGAGVAMDGSGFAARSAWLDARAREARSSFGRVWPFLIYVAMSLAVTMSLGQYYEEEGGLTYWLLLLPLVALPFTRPSDMLRSAMGPGLPAVIFAVLGGGWQLAHGDATSGLQGILLAWGVVWVSSRSAQLKIQDIYLLYALAVFAGICVWLFTDINQWGILPGTTTAPGEAVWRVSFFPNVAYTGFFSLLIIMIAFRDPQPAAKFGRIVALVAIYFTIFSFVRTAVVGLLAFAFYGWLFSKTRKPGTMFWSSLGGAIFINLAIAYSPAIFAAVQNNSFVSRVFLRGEAGLSEYEIWQQLYRPYIWGQHIHQFITSPNLMGWGSTDFNELKTVALVTGNDQSGDVSLPTRLIAQYGVAGFFLPAWMIWRLYIFAKRGDAWGCACFPAVVLALAHWGTMFHPTDAMFGLFMMLAMHGSLSFPEVRAYLQGRDSVSATGA